MKKINNPATLAQKIFGAQFQNQPILNERPEGMSFEEYKKRLRWQTAIIKQVTR